MNPWLEMALALLSIPAFIVVVIQVDKARYRRMDRKWAAGAPAREAASAERLSEYTAWMEATGPSYMEKT